jgi:flagellar capping protein FliD
MKNFKEYLGGFRLGSFDNVEPMADLGDLPPKGMAGKDSRGVGLNAVYSSQAAGTIKPMLTAKKIQKKNKTVKEEIELTELQIKDIQTAAKKFAKGIYDKLKRMVTTRQRYEYAAKTLQAVIDRKKKERAKEGLPLRHDIGYYAAAVGNTFMDIDPKKLQTMVHENLNEIWALEDLYSDDNPKDTVRGTGYGDASSARKTLQIIKSVDKERQMQIVNTLYNRAKHHANQTSGMRDAMSIFKKWIEREKIKESALYQYMVDKKIIKD